MRHTALCAGHFCSEAGKEVIDCLFGCQFGYGWHDAEGVGRQHDNVLGMPGAASWRGIGDEVERIGRTGILSLATVVEIDLPGGG